MINNIGKVTIYVNNQEEAKDFWINKMNFIIKLEQPMGPNMKWLEVAPSEESFTTFVIYEKRLMLAQNSNANVAHPNIILSTNNIDATYDQMKSNGINVGEIMNMPYGKMFKFQDQDNNEYLVREDK
ncbi:MAG: VOC family protein [Clostridiales bacterium]|nr:VOC family protein [Clostridiales bacterium]